eukprot:2966063-Amphidinium_carterae.1
MHNHYSTAGRGSHHLLPYEGGLHVYNVYGYSADHLLALEKNRGLVTEILGSVAGLGNRLIIAGDRNFEPDDMPTDLVHGEQFSRPLSDDIASARG